MNTHTGQIETVIRTARLRLRRPELKDAGAVFTRYAADPAVTRYLSWPTHQTIDDTRLFVASSDAEWDRWPGGPLLIECARTRRLLGSTGLAFETSVRASTGYLLARDAWRQGIASEALAAVVRLAERLAVSRLYAVCHVDNVASIRVLERGGFAREPALLTDQRFPNLDRGLRHDAYSYVYRP